MLFCYSDCMETTPRPRQAGYWSQQLVSLHVQPSCRAEEPSQVMLPVSPVAGLVMSSQLWVIFFSVCFWCFRSWGILLQWFIPGPFETLEQW